MQKITIIFNFTCISTILLSTPSMQGMKREKQPISTLSMQGMGTREKKPSCKQLVIQNHNNHSSINTRPDADTLIESAVIYDNIQGAANLLKEKADPNTKTQGYPVFFRIKTISMAQIFINHGVDLQAIKDDEKTNVLWHTIADSHFPSDIIRFYLQRGVNSEQLHPANGSCLFHKILQNNDIEHAKRLERINLLLQDTRSLKTINTIDKARLSTPLDIANTHLDSACDIESPEDVAQWEEVYQLLRDHGGVHADEIASDVSIIMREENRDELVENTKKLVVQCKEIKKSKELEKSPRTGENKERNGQNKENNCIIS